jgi:hypothetical protein
VPRAAFYGLGGKQSTKDFRTLTAYIVTMGSQIFLASNIGNQSLHDAISAALKVCSNDLKHLLLVCLSSDLRLPGYQKLLQDYVEETSSMAAIEMIYLQTRYLLITHDSLHVPASLIAAFQASFRRRHQLFGERKTNGSFSSRGTCLSTRRRISLIQSNWVGDGQKATRDGLGLHDSTLF